MTTAKELREQLSHLQAESAVALDGLAAIGIAPLWSAIKSAISLGSKALNIGGQGLAKAGQADRAAADLPPSKRID